MSTRDLSVLIAARHEKYLKPTVEDVLRNRRANTDVIVVADGEWPLEPLEKHDDVDVYRTPCAIGQRAAVNEAARLSTARFVMKLDAHCSLAPGFDVALMRAAEALGPDVVQVPRQYHLHVYNWQCRNCGDETHHGPEPTKCKRCGGTGPFTELRIWERRSRHARKSTDPPASKHIFADAWRFDATLHFQYFPEWEYLHPHGDTVETMSILGACFFCTREYFWRMGGLDESHGSWGQFGTEISCKAWLSGGRVVTNRQTWYAHFFRVGGLAFPYPLDDAQVSHAREYSRALWMRNEWPQQIHPLRWLIEKFWIQGRNKRNTLIGVPGWTQEQLDALPKTLPVRGEEQRRIGRSAVDMHAGCNPTISERRNVQRPSKGLVYYSDCQPEPLILDAVRAQLQAVTPGPITAVTLAPVDFGDLRIVLPLERGYLAMFTQILAGLEALDTEYAFLVEHDVLYSAEHFQFTPPRDDTFYYNQHVYKVDVEDGKALHYLCSQTSGLCANRQLLIAHYRARVARVEREGYSRTIGFEPGTRKIRHGGIDDRDAATWMSAVPNIDLRHGHNLTPSRWKKEQFKNQKYTAGWTEANGIPGWSGWADTRGRVRTLLEQIAQPAPEPARREAVAQDFRVAAGADQAANRIGIEGRAVALANVREHVA